MPKGGIEYCKIKNQFISRTKNSFWDVVLFGSNSMFVNICFQFGSHCVVHQDEK